MMIDSNKILSVTEANQNFSKAAKAAEREGHIVLFKNNRPRYILVDIEKSPIIEMTEDEKIDFVARRILKKHRKAFEELAR